MTLRQHSPESEAIYGLILALQTACAGDWKRLASDGPISEWDVQYWLEYATIVLASLGNSKSFGDLKFVPRIPRAELRKLAEYAGGEAKRLFIEWRKFCIRLCREELGWVYREYCIV